LLPFALAGEWGLGFVFRSQVKSVSYRPSAGPSHLSLSGQRKVTQRKATPVWRPPGILPYGFACGLRGFADIASCAGRTRAHPCARPCGPSSTPARRQTGAPLIGHPGRTAAGCRTVARWTMARTDPISSCSSFRAGSRVQRRVAQEAGGERRACSSTWMCELGCCAAATSLRSNAPADGFRATQGTDTAQQWRRGSRVAFLWVTSHVRRASCPPPFGPPAAFGRAPARLVARQREVTRFGRRPKRSALDLALACSETRPIRRPGRTATMRRNGRSARAAAQRLAEPLESFDEADLR